MKHQDSAIAQQIRARESRNDRIVTNSIASRWILSEALELLFHAFNGGSIFADVSLGKDK